MNADTVPSPPYETLLSLLEERSGLTKGLLGIVSFGLVVIPTEILNLSGLARRSAEDALCIYGVTVVLVVGLSLLQWAYHDAKKATFAIRKILTRSTQEKRLRRDLGRMFGGRMQNRFAAGGVLVLMTGVLMMRPDLRWAPWLAFMIIGSVGSAVLGYGFGLAVTTMWWVHSLPRYGTLRLLLLPAYTPALQAVSALTGKFAILFISESALAIGLFFSIHWQNASASKVMSAGVAAPVVLLCVAFCIYPQFAIRRVIEKRKRVLLTKVTRAVPELSAQTVRAERVSAAADVFCKIQESPSFALDLTTVAQFAVSISAALWTFATQIVGEDSVRRSILSAGHALFQNFRFW